MHLINSSLVVAGSWLCYSISIANVNSDASTASKVSIRRAPGAALLLAEASILPVVVPAARILAPVLPVEVCSVVVTVLTPALLAPPRRLEDEPVAKEVEAGK